MNSATKSTPLPPAGLLAAESEDLLEILRMLAHRLSQPLTSLRGSVEVALMGEMDESECRRVLETSLQESHRMAGILETLRDVLEMEGAGEPVQPVSWTRSVEQLLRDASSFDENDCPRLACEVKGDVWVKAIPQHLDTATARLIGAALRAARSRREVRVSLSVHGDTARLSVCEEGVSSQEGAGAGRFPPTAMQAASLLDGLDKWIVRRSIERQGGWLKVSPVSDGCLCYQLNLPLAAAEIVRS